MNDWQPWLEDYFQLYRPVFDPAVRPALVAFHDLAVAVRGRGAKLMFAGNGASASISSHGAVDFTKQGRVRAVDFNEPNLITALSNDYGYENWIARAIGLYADAGDALVLTSTSGTSPNVVNAAREAKARGSRSSPSPARRRTIRCVRRATSTSGSAPRPTTWSRARTCCG